MERIGRYRLERRIGAGSFATVWLGHDDDLDVRVAVKVLAENWVDNDDVRNRFLAEARLMRRIRDDRIVRVYDIGMLAPSHPGSGTAQPYFVMDYCNSGSLSDLRRDPGPPAQALRLCADACRALDVLHRHRVVHRDVTPGNLLLDTDRDGDVHVLLADLGVAKEMIDQQGLTMTAGTPAYMAPEQATGQPVDPRADIYAMACVTYAVLTGRPPFAVQTVADVIGRDPDDRPALLTTTLGTPARLDDVLLAALSIDPDGRPQTGSIMARTLDEIADAMASVSATTVVNEPTEFVPPEPPAPRTPPAADPSPTRLHPGTGPTGSPDLAVQAGSVPAPAPVLPLTQSPFAAPPAAPSRDPAPFVPSETAPFAPLNPFGASSSGPVNPFVGDQQFGTVGRKPGRTPARGWQFWALIAFCGVLVAVGVLFLTLAIVR